MVYTHQGASLCRTVVNTHQGASLTTRFTVGQEEETPSTTRFTVGLEQEHALPHPLHCWVVKEPVPALPPVSLLARMREKEQESCRE